MLLLANCVIDSSIGLVSAEVLCITFLHYGSRRLLHTSVCCAAPYSFIQL